MFQDRKDAGEKLARTLKKYKGQHNVLVLAIPRGGVEVGYYVAKYLDADFSILVSRKLPYPKNLEAGFGAITEDGSVFLLDEARKLISKETINRIIEEQRKEMSRRIKVLRQGKSLPQMRGKTVILVDDGIAIGSTMIVSLMLCRKQKAKRVIVAVPVSARRLHTKIYELADEVVVLERPFFFNAVAQVYKNWYDVPDEEVHSKMQMWRMQKRKKLNNT